MNELKVFQNSEFGELGLLLIDGKEYFPATECAKMLGYENPWKAVGDHCRYLTKREVPHPQSPDKTIEKNFIPEGDLYRLIVSSKLPEAEKFEKWVFDEILPAIRKTGGYIAGEETMTDDELMARALTVACEKLKQRDDRIAQLASENSRLTVEKQIMAPKADYFDAIVDRNLLTNFRETAKQLNIKERALIGFLMERKYLYRDQKGKLMPYAEKNNGLFELKETMNEKTAWAGTQTLITPKGRETFRLMTQGIS